MTTDLPARVPAQDERPRVLFLSRRFLFPLDTGGKIRTAKILEALRGHWQVTLVGHFDPPVDGPYRTELESVVERFLPVEPPPADTGGGATRFVRRARHALSSLPLTVQYELSPALRARVSSELRRGEYTLFVCDFLHGACNAPRHPPCATLLFTHNVESRITRRHHETARTTRERWFWRWQHALMERYEARTTRAFDRVVAVSESDRQEFESRFGLRSVREIPTGVDVEAWRPTGAAVEPGLIAFCGSMDWLPNQDGVRWFAQNVLPAVRREVPEARLRVIGRAPPADLQQELAQSAGLELTGWVPDVRPLLEAAQCVVVPLRVGGGTRIKIYEAMALEKAVVSTTIGAEGLPLTPRLHFQAADDPAAFAARVVECLQRPDEARAMAVRAATFVRSQFGWDRVALAFASIGAEAMAARGTRGDS
jgi:polysaccharide biosynthesis protein PslH